MELTLDQALKNGCTQEEEMFYSTLQTILEAHPAHPDANYHMGLLAVDVNKILLLASTVLEVILILDASVALDALPAKLAEVSVSVLGL